MNYNEKINYLESLISDIKREGELVPPLYYLMTDNEDWFTEEELDADIHACEMTIDYIYSK